MYSILIALQIILKAARGHLGPITSHDSDEKIVDSPDLGIRGTPEERGPAEGTGFLPLVKCFVGSLFALRFRTLGQSPTRSWGETSNSRKPSRAWLPDLPKRREE